MKLISIILPCFNEEDGIVQAIRNADLQLQDNDSFQFEFIFVDDHSRDATAELLQEEARSKSRVKVVCLGSNAGSHVACRAGLEYAAGDAAIFLTADLQEGTDLVRQMMTLWSEGAEVVATIAEGRDRGSILSNLFARAYYWLIRHASDLAYLEDVRAIPRLLDRKVIDRYCRLAPPKHNMITWILQQNFPVAYVRYTPAARRHGKSKWPLKRRLVLAMNTLLELTPLFLTGWFSVGVLFLLAGGVAGGISLAGVHEGYGWWWALSGLILFCTGVVLCSLGMIGLYLWRLYSQFRHGLEYNVQYTYNISGKGRVDRHGSPGGAIRSQDDLKDA